jgi:SagB-type dehydrogenase family enzyme
VALPPAGPASQPAPAAGPDQVSIAQVATLLAGSVGCRPDPAGTVAHRWSPTGGNLASAQAFLLIRRVPGLEPGCYYYHPGEHRLYRTSTDIPQVGAGADAPVVLVFTAALQKVRRKYSSFALKLVHQDAGCALLTAYLVAGRCGLDLADVDPADWPDPATPMLTDLRLDPVTAVLAVRPGPAGTTGGADHAGR